MATETLHDDPQQQHDDDAGSRKAGGKARAQTRNTKKARPAGPAAPTDIRARFTMRAGADGNALPVTTDGEQQHAAAGGKPAKATKPRKPAARRHRKATRKSKSVRSRTRKPKASRKPPIPKFPNSLPGSPDEPTPMLAAEQVERAQIGGEHKDEQPKVDEPPATKKPQRTAQQIAEEETCRAYAYDRWAKRLIETRRNMIRENIGNVWPPANPELHEAIATAPEEIAKLAEKIAKERGYSLKAADVKRDKPRHLWRILKHYWPRYGDQSSEQFNAWVAEKVEHFQSRYLRQEQFRRLDDLDDEEQRIEDDIDAALDRAVEKAARDFHLDEPAIWDALIEGFRNHPMLADIVDDVPGKVIFEAGEEFRVTADPYSVWARFGARPGQPPGRIVFTWARIFKVALIPNRHSTDLDNKRPWHHFRLLKKESGREIETEVVIPGKLVVKGSTFLPAIRFVRNLGARVYMRAGMEKEYGAKILRFLDWVPTRRIGKRLPGIGWHKTVDDRDLDFLLRPDRAVLPSSRAPVPVDHENVEPEIVYELDSQTANGWRGEMKGGSAEGWRHHAARHAKDSNVVFGVGVLLSASMLKFSSEWARIHNNWGLKKIGKSAVSQIVQAFVGKPYRPGGGGGTFGFGLHATSNKVIERARHRSDYGLPLDEHGSLTAKEFADLVYPLVAGEEKGRWGREEQSFNTMVLMNGEKSFLKRVQDAGLNVNPGQLVRVLDEPAEVQPGSALESVSGDSAEIERASKQIYDWTKEHYGYPGLEWQQHLVDLQSGRIRDESERGMERWRAIPEVQSVPVPPGYGSMIGGFALPAAALEMARLAGNLPATWTRETNDSMVLACMERWADAQITQERQVREKIVTGLRDEGRFTFLRKTAGGLVGARPSDAADLAGDWQAQINDGERWGFVKIDDRHPRICIALAAFEDLCGGRLQALELANRFLERGWLEREGDRLTKNEMIREGRTHRCYVLRDAFLLDDAALLTQERAAS
jgi:hypothetical protein